MKLEATSTSSFASCFMFHAPRYMINLSIFLILYVIYLAIFVMFSFFNLYIMLRFGFVSFWAYFVTLGYIILSVIVIGVSYYFIAQIDWTQPIQIGFSFLN